MKDWPYGTSADVRSQQNFCIILALSQVTRKQLSMERITVAIVHSHDLTRVGISTAIRSMSGFQLLGKASSGREALQLLPIKKPDIMILAMTFTDLEVQDLLPQLQTMRDRHALKTKFLLLGVEDLPDRSIASAIGADAFVSPLTTMEELRVLMLELS